MTTSNIRELGPQVAANGYLVCHIAKGHKVPMYKDWPNKPMTEQECEDCANGEDGVGILCGKGEYPICAFDFDIDGDEKLDEAMRNALSFILRSYSVRVGKAPKFLVMVRAEEAGWRKYKTPLYEKDGKTAQLEVLGAGQQFVAYHTHPITGKPYVWEFEELGAVSPVNTPAKDLPVVSWGELSDIVDTFEALAREAGYRASEVEVAPDDEATIKELTPVMPPIPNLTVVKAREILQDLKINLGAGSYDEWIRLGAALHHQFSGAPEALALWDELSADFPESYQPGLCEQKWRTFSDDKVGGATFRTYMSQWRMRSGSVTELTAQGLVARMIREYGSQIVFLPATKGVVGFNPETCQWDSLRGRQIVVGFIRDLFASKLPQEAKELKDREEDERAKKVMTFAYQLRKRGSAETTLFNQLSNTLDLAFEDSVFDSNPDYFGVQNGVVNLKTFTLEKNAPELMVSRYSKAAFDPQAKCPTWERTVSEWFNEDQTVVRFVQRLMGAAMTGAPKDDVMGLLRGLGCNGKTSFIEIMADVFGSYAVRVKEETLLGKNGIGQGGQARSDLVRMRGARLVMCSETSENGRLREADIKMLTGRDPFPARAPYGTQDIMITPTWLLMIATNHLPEIKGDDNGIWRRILDVEFPRDFDNDPKVRKDIHLGEKLKAELPGILNWCLEGLRQYREKGLGVPDKIRESVAEYRKEMDVVAEWADSRLEAFVDGRLTQTELYQNFRQYMISQGETKIESQRWFSRRFNKKFKDSVSRSNGRTILKGFRLKAPEGELTDEDLSAFM